MKIARFVSSAALLALVAPTLAAQATPAKASAPCIENLDSLASKVYANYSGFRLEVKGEKKTRYDRMLAPLQARARAAQSAACLPVLRDYIKWFDDPHLFIYENNDLDSAESARRARSVRVIPTTEASAREYFRTKAKALDPIEGIWYDTNLRVAILRDPQWKQETFNAVILSADTAGWPVGSVRATFRKVRAGEYTAQLAAPNHAMYTRDAAIHRRTVLRISPTIWAKEYPVLPADSGFIARDNPRRPTLVTRQGSVIISMPSHDPTYKRELDSLVAAHHADLIAASRIIIDLRGNEGGSSFTSNSLLPYIASAEKRETPYTTDFREAVVLSSPGHIAYAKSAFGSDTSEFVRTLVARMEAHPGEMVPVVDPAKPAEPKPADSVIAGNWKIGLLVDGGTVSASEVLVLDAMKSRRATVFGEPTDGALDYQSTRIMWFSPNERRWALGYPTITAHAKLPEGGMRGKGIAPDVRLDLSRLADPISTVEKLLDSMD